MLIVCQANPKLADLRDDDERLPIHWAISYGHLDIVILLAARKGFDPDVQVLFLPTFDDYLLTLSGFLWMDAINDCCELEGWRRVGGPSPAKGGRCQPQK